MDSVALPLWASAVLVVAGAALGLLTARELSTGGYRIPEDDVSGPVPRSWWAAPVLAGLVLVVTTTIGDLAAYAALPAYLLFAWLSVCLVWIDLDVHRLPVGLTWPTLPAFVLLLVPPTIVTGDWGRLVTALGCAVGLALLYLVFALLPGGGFGGGDVQLAPAIGLLLGWLGVGHVVVGTMAAFVLGGLVAAGLLLSGRAGRTTAMAFGPAMCGGLFVALAWTDELLAGFVGA